MAAFRFLFFFLTKRFLSSTNISGISCKQRLTCRKWKTHRLHKSLTMDHLPTEYFSVSRATRSAKTEWQGQAECETERTTRFFWGVRRKWGSPPAYFIYLSSTLWTSAAEEIMTSSSMHQGLSAVWGEKKNIYIVCILNLTILRLN